MSDSNDQNPVGFFSINDVVREVWYAPFARVASVWAAQEWSPLKLLFGQNHGFLETVAYARFFFLIPCCGLSEIKLRAWKIVHGL